MPYRSNRNLPIGIKTKKHSSLLPSLLPGLYKRWIPALQGAAYKGELPRASLIYGVAAAALIAICIYFLFTGMWLTGILLLFPAGCLFGFALHFLRYTD